MPSYKCLISYEIHYCQAAAKLAGRSHAKAMKVIAIENELAAGHINHHLLPALAL